MEVHVESLTIDPKQVGDVKALLKEAKRPVILLQSQVSSRIERVHSVIIRFIQSRHPFYVPAS